MKSVFFALSAFFFTSTAFSQPIPVRTGIHAFTIQWISFNSAKPGAVAIKSVGKGKYSIEGEQRDKLHNEYVTIKGTFKAIERKLYFDGKIVSRISSINNGQVCELKGPAVFSAAGKRKYWRLQQMLNCDGETTDYIDIFF
jgi:hypothetical protein